MIYLDYSATTTVNNEVLHEFININKEYFGNPNSSHKLGFLAKDLIDQTTIKIKNILNVPGYEVIYTSGATEANNLGIIGFCEANKHRGNHIISSPYEHSSVTSCLNHLEKIGYEVDILQVDANGDIDLSDLEELINENTILVTISAINSELGIPQNIEAINRIVKKHPNVIFHSDMTQAIGKINVDLNNCDLISLTGHKFYGLKGIGALLRKESINLMPVVIGGKSTSIFRGGTPATPLIHSLGIALELAYLDFNKKIKYIKSLKAYLIELLDKHIPSYHLNYKDSIPQIINLSFVGIKSHIIQKALSEKEIYISTQTACNSESSFSVTVKKLTGSDALAESSLRVSLSHLTTKAELDEFILALKELVNENL